MRLARADRLNPPAIQPPSATSILIGALLELEPPEPKSGRTTSPAPGPSLNVSQPTRRAAPDLAARLAALLQPPLSLFLEPGGVLEWPAALRPFQRDGVAALLSRRELLLADDMGLGKTVQCLAALRILFRRGTLEQALIVCPATLLAQWRREARRWAPELKLTAITGPALERGLLWRLPAPVKLVSYETLRSDVLDLKESPALQTSWSVVVLDEASRIKNADTGATRACKRLPRDRRWALTGTPLENRIEDLESILDFLDGQPGHRGSSLRPPILSDRLRSVQLRRKKADVLLELPPKTIVEQTIELGPHQREAYDLAERAGVVHLQRLGRQITVTHVLELIMRLKQISNCDAASGESAKLNDIEQRLGALVEEGHRALIFSQFIGPDYGVEMIARRLNAFSPVTYTGAMSSATKDEVLKKFEHDTRHKALILSLRAGGVGLNLQAASYVFHLDRWWNPAVEDQAESRAHRMGQQFPVTAYRYIATGTIEERIDAKLRAKRALFKEIVDDVTMDLAGALTERELFEVVAPELLRQLQPGR